MQSSPQLRPNKSLHRTLVDMAKMCDYTGLFRMAEDMLALWSAGELGRWAAVMPGLTHLECQEILVH